MGASQSTQEEWSSNELLLKLVDSKQNIPQEDNFWNELLSFHPKVTFQNDGKNIIHCSFELSNRMVISNLESANIHTLLCVFLDRCSKLPVTNNAPTKDNVYLHTYNSLFILRCFIHYLVEIYPESQIIRQLVASDNLVFDDYREPSKLMTQFVDSLLHILINVPVTEKTYLIHLEDIHVILVLLSTEIFAKNKSTQLEIYPLIFGHKNATELCKVLLKRFTEQQNMPHPDKLYSSFGGSIILDIAADIIGYFMPSDPATSPLARSALLLICVLCNHQADWQINEFKKHLSLLSDELNDVCSTICKVIDKEETTLIVYNLLQINGNFKPLIVSQEDIESWMIPMLQTIYKASDTSGHHVYMSLIILLILTEDREFIKKIHTTMTKNVSWYLDRNLGEISLGGLTVLVTTRTIQYNLLKMRDEYLHTNCLAALSNMSSQFTNLHPYVCQRLVGLFEILAKTYNRAKQELLPIERALRIILEVINSCLSNQLVSNTNLIYTLLYKREIFEPFKNNTAFNDIINNLDQVLEYFTSKLEKSEEPCNDVSTVLSIIIEASPKWPSHRLQKFPELKFRYVEEDCPGEFFTPYIWSLVSQYSYVHLSLPEQIEQDCS